MRVVPFRSEYADRLRAVCLEQASERARTDEVYGRFTLLMYCDAYLEQGVAYALLDEEGVPQGYILAAKDIDSWTDAFEPYRQEIVALGSEFEGRVSDELSFYQSVRDEYPAHLHIDIAEACTGKGGGRLLMQALLDRLRADGVPGVVFGVAAGNRRAIGFYRHMGFEQFAAFGEGDEGGFTFCMKL